MDNLRWAMVKAIVKRELPECLKETVKDVESRYGVTLAK